MQLRSCLTNLKRVRHCIVNKIGKFKLNFLNNNKFLKNNLSKIVKNTKEF